MTSKFLFVLIKTGNTIIVKQDKLERDGKRAKIEINQQEKEKKKKKKEREGGY